MLKCTSTTSKYTILMDCMRANLTFPTISRGHFWIQGSFALRGCDYEEFPDEIMEALLSELFLTRKMKTLSRPNGLMLYGKVGIEFLSISEMLCQKMKIRLRLIRARPILYMISDNSNVSPELVDCSLHTRPLALKDDYHKKRLDAFAYTPVECNYLETLAKTFINSVR